VTIPTDLIASSGEIIKVSLDTKCDWGKVLSFFFLIFNYLFICLYIVWANSPPLL
jgi:hypothetical protein